jgi:hypothetical protein
MPVEPETNPPVLNAKADYKKKETQKQAHKWALELTGEERVSVLQEWNTRGTRAPPSRPYTEPLAPRPLFDAAEEEDVPQEMAPAKAELAYPFLPTTVSEVRGVYKEVKKEFQGHVESMAIRQSKKKGNNNDEPDEKTSDSDSNSEEETDIDVLMSKTIFAPPEVQAELRLQREEEESSEEESSEEEGDSEIQANLSPEDRLKFLLSKYESNADGAGAEGDAKEGGARKDGEAEGKKRVKRKSKKQQQKEAREAERAAEAQRQYISDLCCADLQDDLRKGEITAMVRVVLCAVLDYDSLILTHSSSWL